MGVSVRAEIARQNYKYKCVAENIGMPPSTFYKKLRRNDFSIEEVQKIFRFIGVKLLVAG